MVQESQMRKWILLAALAMPCMAAAQTGFGSPQAAAPQKKIEIKDPNEANAFNNAMNANNDVSKAELLEKFVQQYPGSVVNINALEQLMAAYEKTNNVPKLIDSANRLLQADPNNLRALALVAYLQRQQAAASTKPDEIQKTLAEAARYAERGLQAEQSATKPDGVSDADFQSLKSSTSAIFNGVAGFAALQNKDYASAQTHLQASVDTNPTDLGDVYPLALAYLAGWPSPQVNTPPPTAVEGIWYLARASAIAAGADQKASILKYGHSLYTKYHGDDVAFPAWAPNSTYAANVYVVGGGKVGVGDSGGKSGKTVMPAFGSPADSAVAGPADTYIEKCTTPGKSGATPPAWCTTPHCVTQDGPLAWSNEGINTTWDAIAQQAAKKPKPPANFALKSRPTAGEEAAQMAEKSAKDMGFDEFEFIFTSGNQQAADKVWEQIKDKPIAFEAKVTEASATKLKLAASAEDGEKKPPVADVELTMVVPIPAKNIPKAGSTIDVSGTPVSKTDKPFMITMSKGALIKQ
jgi:tetratricopeptide (TPR) repeat protein